MNYPSFHPGTEDGIEPLVRFLLRPAALLVKGFARRPEGVEVFLESDPPGPNRWRILVSECVDFGMIEGPIRTACVLRDHPVLWRHHPHEMELTVSGAVRDPAAAVAALVRVHREVVEETSGGFGARWVHPEHFTGDLRRLEALLRGGGGTVARGPERLMEAWAKTLDREGGSTGLLSRRGRWDKPKANSRPLRALFLGESFALGAALTCTGA